MTAQEELKALEDDREWRRLGIDAVDQAFRSAFDRKQGGEYRRIALTLSAELTKAEEALGLCAVSVPIEAVELIEALEQHLSIVMPFVNSTKLIQDNYEAMAAEDESQDNLAEKRQAYLRRKEV